MITERKKEKWWMCFDGEIWVRMIGIGVLRLWKKMKNKNSVGHKLGNLQYCAFWSSAAAKKSINCFPGQHWPTFSSKLFWCSTWTKQAIYQISVSIYLKIINFYMCCKLCVNILLRNCLTRAPTHWLGNSTPLDKSVLQYVFFYCS